MIDRRLVSLTALAMIAGGCMSARTLRTGDTPERAMQQANVAPVDTDRAVGKRPVLLQVPHPSMVFL